MELNDALFREAKAHAALEGVSLKSFVERGLRLLLEKPKAKKRDRDLTIPIFKAKGTKKVYFPPDVVNRMDEMEDQERYEASLRR